MKIQLLSDLHNEFLRHRKLVPGHLWAGEIPQTDADVIILAGDIDVGLQGVQWALRESERLAKPIIYVPGNHEFYGFEYFELKKDIAECCEGTQVCVLDTAQIELNGVRFIGTTLWTDYAAVPGISSELAMLHCANALADHRRIRFKQGDIEANFRPQHALAEHRWQRQWLEQQLTRAFDGKSVVVTHHAPHPVCQHKKFPLDAISAAFQSDLGALIEKSDIALWAYGHSHSNLDEIVSGTRIVSNQAGYPGERVDDFLANLVIEI